MYVIVSKTMENTFLDNGKFNILDTEDCVIEKYTPEETISIVEQGVDIVNFILRPKENTMYTVTGFPLVRLLNAEFSIHKSAGYVWHLRHYNEDIAVINQQVEGTLKIVCLTVPSGDAIRIHVYDLDDETLPFLIEKELFDCRVRYVEKFKDYLILYISCALKLETGGTLITQFELCLKDWKIVGAGDVLFKKVRCSYVKRIDVTGTGIFSDKSSISARLKLAGTCT